MRVAFSNKIMPAEACDNDWLGLTSDDPPGLECPKGCCDASFLAGGGDVRSCSGCAGSRSSRSSDFPRRPHGGAERKQRQLAGLLHWRTGRLRASDENFAGSNKNMLAALLDHNVIEEMQVSQWISVLASNRRDRRHMAVLSAITGNGPTLLSAWRRAICTASSAVRERAQGSRQRRRAVRRLLP